MQLFQGPKTVAGVDSGRCGISALSLVLLDWQFLEYGLKIQSWFSQFKIFFFLVVLY